MTAEQRELEKQLKAHEFALVEAALFLDTHPADREALAFYKKQTQLYEQALEAYAVKYGPIEHSQAASEDRWTWIDGPWPWEG